MALGSSIELACRALCNASKYGELPAPLAKAFQLSGVDTRVVLSEDPLALRTCQLAAFLPGFSSVGISPKSINRSVWLIVGADLSWMQLHECVWRAPHCWVQARPQQGCTWVQVRWHGTQAWSNLVLISSLVVSLNRGRSRRVFHDLLVAFQEALMSTFKFSAAKSFAAAVDVAPARYILHSFLSAWKLPIETSDQTYL